MGVGQLAVETRRSVAARAASSSVCTHTCVCTLVRTLALIDASVWTRRGGSSVGRRSSVCACVRGGGGGGKRRSHVPVIHYHSARSRASYVARRGRGTFVRSRVSRRIL